MSCNFIVRYVESLHNLFLL